MSCLSFSSLKESSSFQHVFISLLVIMSLSVTDLVAQKPLTEKQLKRRNYEEVLGEFMVCTDTLQPDEYPLYPDGTEGLMKDIERSLRYPESAAISKKSGRVVVSCVIDEKGKVTDVEVVESHSRAFDRAAVRAIETGLRRWVPAYKDGKPVSLKYGFPISFKIPQRPEFSRWGE